jgi:hypothetical protein
MAPWEMIGKPNLSSYWDMGPAMRDTRQLARITGTTLPSRSKLITMTSGRSIHNIPFLVVHGAMVPYHYRINDLLLIAGLLYLPWWRK